MTQISWCTHGCLIQRFLIHHFTARLGTKLVHNLGKEIPSSFLFFVWSRHAATGWYSLPTWYEISAEHKQYKQIAAKKERLFHLISSRMRTKRSTYLSTFIDILHWQRLKLTCWWKRYEMLCRFSCCLSISCADLPSPFRLIF